MEKKILNYFDNSIKTIEDSKILSNDIECATKILIKSLKKNKKIILCGNGGSAADAQHIAAELVGRFKKERQSLPAIALTTDSSILTAIGNDYSFDQIFSRQCESLVNKGDVLIGISTSGNSQNVLNAIKSVRKKGVPTIGILGNNGGKIGKIVDIAIIVNSDSTSRIQEVHRIIYHIICEIVEDTLKKY
ncbi:D-sedoheptulose 7-phosphate isomerase [Nitrosopumilus sp. S6]